MKKQQVFYIHGGSSYTHYEDYVDDLKHMPLRNASDQDKVEKWPATLRKCLGNEYQVFTPSFPNSNNSRYEEWKIWFEKHFEFISDDLILVGWSLGAAFIVRYLTEHNAPVRIRHLFLLAAPYDFFVSAGFKEDGGDFYPDVNKVSSLQKKIGAITIMHSKDDPIVPYEHARKYKEALPQAELVTFEDKNHFLVEELPELVGLIKEL